METSKIIISKCNSYDFNEIYSVLEKHIKFFQFEKFYNKKILLKPNLLSAQKPEKAVTTNPEFLRAVIKLFKSFNCEILVGDSPSTLNFEEVIKETGIKKVCEEEKVEILNLTTYPKIEFDFNKFGIEKIFISKIVEEVDFIINLPKLKTHSLMLFTCGIKNMYGLVPGLVKSKYHKCALNPKDFFEFLYAVYSYKKPELTFVDGILGMDGEGPSGGNIKQFGVIITSDNAESIDLFLSEEIFKNRFYKDILSKKTYKIINLDFPLQKLRLTPPKTFWLVFNFPKWFSNLTRYILNFYPKILKEKCKKCGKCWQICPKKTIKYLNGFYFIDKKGCISCFCCAEVCPYNAVKIKRNFVFDLIMKLRELIFR